jgi:ATP-dependent HslUV protease ATP-binding subunit HslU
MDGKALTPKEIVTQLDRHIIGQDKAKRAVAIALRNRYRRSQLTPSEREEIMPKNILMIGPTGVGKTEIARRLATLAQAPFIKVEATKYTEIGYVGRDVEGMVRDLIEYSVRHVKTVKTKEIETEVNEAVNIKLAEILAGIPVHKPKPVRPSASHTDQFDKNPQDVRVPLSGHSFDTLVKPTEPVPDDSETRIEEQHERIRERVRERLAAGKAEEDMVEVSFEETKNIGIELLSSQGLEDMGMQLQQMLGDMAPKKRTRRKVPVHEAREILKSQEIEARLDMDAVVRIAVKRAEEHGIIFVDEIDKIAGKDRTQGPDVSREGVQRDILPLVEGTTVTTKYGPVKTDHMLFIAAGAFHMSKPSDLIPEFQGRFPIRVELDSLTAEDFKRILVEPENALTHQYKLLLGTEGITIEFTQDGIEALAEIATHVNDQAENIGARRLSTVLEKVLEEVSYEGPDLRLAKVVINREYVMKQVSEIAKDTDLSRYIL